jgi:hypothetical protein
MPAFFFYKRISKAHARPCPASAAACQGTLRPKYRLGWGDAPCFGKYRTCIYPFCGGRSRGKLPQGVKGRMLVFYTACPGRPGVAMRPLSGLHTSSAWWSVKTIRQALEGRWLPGRCRCLQGTGWSWNLPRLAQRVYRPAVCIRCQGSRHRG